MNTIMPAFEEAGLDEGMSSMEAARLVATRPAIRSSDFSLCLHSPFSYFLGRRLGLVKALRWSKALSRGSWAHSAFQHYELSPQSRRVMVERTLEQRQQELSACCSSLGMSPAQRQEVVLRERADADSALAWMESALDVPISADYGTAREFLARPYWKVLARECRLVRSLTDLDDPSSSNAWFKPKAVVQPDLMLYHSGQNSVFIVDLKTTSASPLLRAASCPYEFQCRHYMRTAHHLMQRGLVQREFGIPADARLGGMIHLIVRKPSIEFGMKDRNFVLDESPFKSGPRKGLPRNERIYQGEPVWENYLERVRSWYRADGEYAHLAPEWTMDPPVNMSVVSASILDDRYESDQYRSQWRLVGMWARRKGDPSMFPHPPSLVAFNRLDDHAPFVMNPPSAWPEIIRQEGWIRVERDQIPEDVVDDVIPEPGSEMEDPS